MATIRINRPIKVDDIYVHVKCPSCRGKQVSMRMHGRETRKNCPLCNRTTYIFTITPLRGFVQIEVITVSENQTPTVYELLATDVEIDGQEVSNG